MALPPIATANHVIEFLDRNDSQYTELGYNWHSTVSTWTKTDVQAMIRAAQKNTSITSLTVVPTRLDNDEADAVAGIVQCFGCIVEFQIEGFISRAEYREGRTLRNTNVVDRLLTGIVRSPSSVTRFMTVFAVGQEAMMGFAERFPSIEFLQFGAVSLPCILTHDFSEACETAYPSLPHLHTVKLRASGVLSMVRLISGLAKAPSLQSVVIEFVDIFLGTPNVPRELAILGTVHPTLSNISILCPEFPMSIEDFFTVEGTLSPSLKHLTFDGCKLPKISVTRRWSPKLHANLTSLQLNDCRFLIAEESDSFRRRVRLDAVTYVCQWLQHLPKLAALYVDGRPIIEDADDRYDDRDDDRAVRPWRALCTNDALTQWCDAITAHPTLQDVTFSLGNETGNESLPSLQSLLRNCHGVRAIKPIFRELALINRDILVQAMEVTHVDLKRLSLRFCRCDWEDEDYALCLRALRNNPSLEHFDLDLEEQMADLETLEQFALALLDLLVANTHLKRLCLTGLPAMAIPGIFDMLLSGLGVNRTLQEVTVEPLVEIGDETSVTPPKYWERWVELLEHNAVLYKVQGFGASASLLSSSSSAAAAASGHRDPAATRASFLMKLNMHGRRALMPGGEIPVGCWPKLLSRMVDNSSDQVEEAPALLYHFLRAKPDRIRTKPPSNGKRNRSDAWPTRG